jgi:hypothetical protein
VKRIIVTGALFAALLAGCGGSSSHLYSLAKTTACLKTQPVRLGGQLDFVASTAIGGAVKIHTSDNFLTLVFGSTVADGNNIAAAYRRFAAKNVGVDDVLHQDENAVMLWHDHWSQADLDLIGGCLK